MSPSSIHRRTGAIGGMAGITAGQPLDTLRIRLQQQDCQSRSILGVWRAMAGAEGVRGLFRGLSYPLYTTALVRPTASYKLELVDAVYLSGSGAFALRGCSVILLRIKAHSRDLPRSPTP